MRDRDLEKKIGAVAERLRNAQLTAEQLATLQSIQYFYRINGEQRVDLYAKRRAFLIGALILLVMVGCLTLSPLSQLTTILLHCCGLQVTYVVSLQTTAVRSGCT